MSSTAMPRSASRSSSAGGEQHRQSGLVELHALPVRRAAEPLVLVPMAVLVLRRDQVAQRVAGLRLGAERQQCAGAFDEIARPNQVIAAALVAGIAPRHAEAGDHRAGIGLIEMGAQHDRGHQRLVADRRRQVEHRHAAFAAARLPAPPNRQSAAAARCRRVASALEIASVAADSALLPKPSASTARRGNSPISATLPGPAVRYCQVIAPLRAKSCQPSLRADIAGAGAPEGVALLRIDRSQRRAERPLLGHSTRRPR